MCKRGALQFVLLKPILAVITIVLFTQHKYTEGFWGPNNGSDLRSDISLCPCMTAPNSILMLFPCNPAA